MEDTRRLPSSLHTAYHLRFCNVSHNSHIPFPTPGIIVISFPGSGPHGSPAPGQGKGREMFPEIGGNARILEGPGARSVPPQQGKHPDVHVHQAPAPSESQSNSQSTAFTTFDTNFSMFSPYDQKKLRDQDLETMLVDPLDMIWPMCQDLEASSEPPQE